MSNPRGMYIEDPHRDPFWDNRKSVEDGKLIVHDEGVQPDPDRFKKEHEQALKDGAECVSTDLFDIYEPPYREAVMADKSISDETRADYLLVLDRHERMSDMEMDAYPRRNRRGRRKNK